MRFKAWINSGEVVLDIQPGQTIQHKTWKPHEEGYDAECVTYEACDEGITRTWASWGRDCDGEIGSESVHFCPWSEIKARTTQAYVGEKCVEWEEVDLTGQVSKVKEWVSQWEDDPGWPNWQEESREHYDQYAQAMGY
jgi:hypothetical protein